MSYIDTERKDKRGPQIVTRKDSAAIVAAVGLQPDWKCLDLGGGSGFLALFIANLVPNGSVTCYEIKKEHAAIIKENILRSGFKNIKLVNKPGEDFTGKNFDLVTMDMKGAEKVIPKIYTALKQNGWLVVYSPHIEQQIACRKSMEKSFKKIKTVENVQKEWTSVAGFTHPIPSQIVHTGFITIARKM